MLLVGLDRLRAFEDTDARYLSISQAMLESGDWLVPRMAGKPHLDKPPVTYWAAAAGFATLGVNPFAGRLLSNLALLATALSVAVAGRRWCGAGGARVAALALLTSGLVFVTSRGLQTDLFQLLLFTTAMFAFGAGIRAPGRPSAVVLALALLGVSMNVKGPIALFVALFVWIPFLILSRSRARVPVRAWLAGGALFVLLGAPWYVVLALRDPEAFRFWLDVQMLGRISGHLVYHIHTPLYLLRVWPFGLLPWTLLAALALWRLRPAEGWRRGDPADLYLLLWATLPVLFFSLPRSQSAQYLLPAFPGAALAIGRALDRGRLGDRLGARLSAATAGLTALLAAVLAAGLLRPEWITSTKVERELLVDLPAHAAALLAVSALALLLAVRSRQVTTRSLTALALSTGLVFTLGFHALAPGLESLEPEGRLAASVPGATLVEFHVWRPSALFYFGQAERASFIKRPRGHEKVAPGQPDPGREELIARLRSDEPVFCLARARDADALTAETGACAVERRPGTVLLANAAAQRGLARLAGPGEERLCLAD